EGLPGAKRSALHLAVANQLEQQVTPATSAAEIAYHRTSALPLGDRDRVLAALVEAGREATPTAPLDETPAPLRPAAPHLSRAPAPRGRHCRRRERGLAGDPVRVR